MYRLVCFLFVTLAAQGASAVYTSSFEGSSSGWTVVRGSAAPDSAVMHANSKSLRVEAGSSSPDACVRSAPVPLTIGKRYELSGWVRTENLTVADLERSPIASGAVLTMASMPFDVHSASVGGTHEWTRLSLKFVASRAQDAILLTAGSGGKLGGKAWFEGVSLDEVSSRDQWPARDAVQTFGPAYRYPAAGWIYLHIEGKPYDRGYQHGYLMSREIPEYLERCAFDLGGKADDRTWSEYRTSANALFLRGFDREILEEMRGIADGANAHGAKWLGRKLDLVDIVVANTTVEMGELRGAVGATPTGLEGLDLVAPAYARQTKKDSPVDHCSAFAATGPATRDGKMVIGHVTWWPLTLAEQTNVMLDIKPDTGHRMLIQSYPGGIESGTDWYQNDAGMVLTETTIDQTPFNIDGTPVAFRARRAIQYGGNIDEIVRELGTANNGLYTNEWLIGDAKNNEIAMYELGTHHTRLWRSSKGEWFGDTPGFYWGDNNAKDLTVSLELASDPHGAAGYIPYTPGVRDLAWQHLYHQYKGQIDEQFAFRAYDAAPLISMSTMDAKVVTADMAKDLMVWAAIGRPNESVWAAPRTNPGPNHGLYPGGYHLFTASAPESLIESVRENEQARLAEKVTPEKAHEKTTDYADRLWKGWVLPASDADTWFVAGSAAYYRLLESKDVEEAMEAQRIRYRGLKLAAATPQTNFQIQQTEGILFLDQVRHKMGDEAFFKLMDDYFSANTTKAVTAQSFLKKAGVTFEVPSPGEGPAYLPGDIGRRLASAVIVYGTAAEAGVNRYAAEQLQSRYRDYNQANVAVLKDFQASDDELQHRDVIFIGRPETNSALAAWAAKIGLHYDGAAIQSNGETFASERDSLVMAAGNPLDASHMVLVLAGNDPRHTVEALNGDLSQIPLAVLEDGKPVGRIR
ncbi:MAG TPA: C45 family autoproteolytic acyltransferase/hydrolase [Bryobacteraceae bacterium]|jgi:hypothetical protein|nr:C45 family autoproteolytic acyltransferase/hydrolase [Bryobacteraceae bacterium]